MKTRPNILLFLTDDHGAWALGCHGNREIQSPVLDQMARGGVRFTNAFTPCPVCSPARACIMTGKTPSQVGVHDWIGGEFVRHDWMREQVSLAEYLKSSGYTCGLVGKWHLGRKHDMPRGFDWFLDLRGGLGKHYGRGLYGLNGEHMEIVGNKTDVIADYAMRFLDQLPTDQSFFLTVGFTATHSPYRDDAHDPETVRLYEHAAFSDIPPYEPHPWVKNEGVGNDCSEAERLSCYRGYYAGVTDIDRNVGRILEGLRVRGRLENTLVIYTSDHGCALGHHGFFGKGNSTRPLNMYETSLRVPLLFQWPGRVPAGLVLEHCVDHYDVFRTICDVADVDSDAGRRCHPGKSLLPFMAGPVSGRDWDDTRFGEYGDLRMIRTPDYKFVKRYPDGPHDLFDLNGDPGEKVNLAGMAEYQNIQQDLDGRLEEFYRTFSDPAKSGLKVKDLPQHNPFAEAWRDGIRESRGMQVS